MSWMSRCAACAPRWMSHLKPSSYTMCAASATCSNNDLPVTDLLHFRRWSLTWQLSLYFALGSLILISAMGAYLYTALDRSLDNEHMVFLANDIDRYRDRISELNAYSDFTESAGWPQRAVPNNRLQVSILGRNREILYAS